VRRYKGRSKLHCKTYLDSRLGGQLYGAGGADNKERKRERGKEEKERKRKEGKKKRRK
jgi:hypothetical protein